jgi:hypothetical protein
MENLSTLLGGLARIKLMRLFLFNPEKFFTLADISTRIKVGEKEVKKEIAILEKATMIKGKVIIHLVEKKKNGKIVTDKKKETAWSLNQNFAYLKQFQTLLIESRLLRNEELIKKISRAGKLKLVILSGVFIQDWSSRVDLFIVADNIKRGQLETAIRNLEAEIGKELVYSYFETADFKYRLGMCDKLVRDVLDYPHQTVVDRLGESEFKK